MAKILLFQSADSETNASVGVKSLGNVFVALNDPWLDETASDALYLRLDASNSPLTGKLILSDEGATANLSTGNYTLRLQSDKQNTGGPAFQFNTGFALTGTNYSHLFSSVGSFLLRMNTQGAEWSIPITVANATDAIKSGAYPIQMDSGVADGATAVGYVFDTANALINATAKPYLFQTGGRGLMALRYEVGGGLLGNDACVFDASVLDAGADIFGALKFITPGSFGLVDFRAPGAAFGMGMNPGAASFYTTRTGGAGDTATLNISFAGGSTAWVTFRADNTVPLYTIDANQTVDFGRNLGNDTQTKFRHFYHRDNGQVIFGNNADATISWDTTDLVINPDAQAAGGRLRINSAAAWSAIGGGTAPALHANLPTGASGTTQRWLTVKDNTGAVYHIPAWSNA